MSSFDFQVQAEESREPSYSDWLEYERLLADEIDNLNLWLGSVQDVTPEDLDAMAEHYGQ